METKQKKVKQPKTVTPAQCDDVEIDYSNVVGELLRRVEELEQQHKAEHKMNTYLRVAVDECQKLLITIKNKQFKNAPLKKKSSLKTAVLVR